VSVESKCIGLFGLFGAGNIGNDGSLEAVVRFLRRAAPHERLLCICHDPSRVEKELDLETAPICAKPRLPLGGRIGPVLERAVGSATMAPHALRHLRRLRALIVPGTGFLDDFTTNPLGWPLDILTWCALARLVGVKVVFVSIGAGPINHPLSRWLMKRTAGAAHYRSYRDTVSKTFIQSIGFDAGEDPVYPDVAFGLPMAASQRQDGDVHRLAIGVGVMAYGGWHYDGARSAQIYATYLDKMTAFVVWLLDEGHTVRLLLGDEMDRQTVDTLARAAGRARAERVMDVTAFMSARTLHDVMGQIAGTDVVVGTRYHNVVCALRMGRPTISIGYAPKNDALLAEMGLEDYCQHIERLDIELLKRQTLRMIAERDAIAMRIRQTVRHFESRLQDQEAALTRLIWGETRSPYGVDRSLRASAT
jgi:polysaccharide pyruvyl transferase WcaK-like protein